MVIRAMAAAVIMMSFCLADLVGATVYSWEDSSGNKVYSNRESPQKAMPVMLEGKDTQRVDKPAVKEKTDFCKSIGELAATIMAKRQEGAAMADLVSKLTGSTDQPAEKICESMVINAYETPRFQGAEYIQRTITDFKNKWYLECYKTVKNSGKTP